MPTPTRRFTPRVVTFATLSSLCFLIAAGPADPPATSKPAKPAPSRNAKTMQPEDPLVLAWLEQNQDASSPEQRLVPSTFRGLEAQTFNNSLVAMAFILHDRRARAERILDFYQDAAANEQNADPTLQSFYLRGAARGFYQHVHLRAAGDIAAYHASPQIDRWMGDMVWLRIAYEHYQRTYKNDRYRRITQQLDALLDSWYMDSPDGVGGYVQHGWRKGDRKLHEDSGHHEGNIDCYALYKLLGQDERAVKIRAWLDQQLDGRTDLPLDLYTWRTMAFGPASAKLLETPENDTRFLKTLQFHGRTLTGPYHSPAPDVNNIWLDGLGHMACAYWSVGDAAHANYYANQLDAAIVTCEYSGITTHALPYTVTHAGGFDWVDLGGGFASTSAWYIFAKQRFNPLTLTIAKPE